MIMKSSVWAVVTTSTLFFAGSLMGQDPPIEPPQDSLAVTPAPDSLAARSEVDVIEVPGIEYRMLATTRTSTLEREMNAAAGDGYRVYGVIGGVTAFGGSEIVAIMGRPLGQEPAPGQEYRVLATNLTSTMQKELQQAGDDGYDYAGQTILKTTFGGEEVVIVVGRERDIENPRYDYKLLATKRTSTMQEEILRAGRDGFVAVGVTVAETMLGGDEVVVIMKRVRA